MFGQLPGKLAHRGLDQRQLVGAAHRSRHIEQEDQIGGRAFLFGQFIPGEPDAQQARVGIPRAHRDIGIDRERLLETVRPVVVVAEVIDEFLGPHRALGRQLAFGNEPAGIGIGAGVDIDREGRDGFAGDQLNRRHVLAVILLAAGRCGHEDRREIAIARFDDRCFGGWGRRVGTNSGPHDDR